MLIGAIQLRCERRNCIMDSFRNYEYYADTPSKILAWVIRDNISLLSGSEAERSNALGLAADS
jgi:hypothetical protein